MMMTENRMRFGGYEFAVENASFRYITQSWSGPGWDFNFRGPCLSGPNVSLFPFGARLLTEAAPLPLGKAADYTGVFLDLPGSFDEVSGEPFFGLNVMEEHEVSDVQLRFVERSGSRYRIEIVGTVAKSILGQPEKFELSGWADELPDHAYPV